MTSSSTFVLMMFGFDFVVAAAAAAVAALSCSCYCVWFDHDLGGYLHVLHPHGLKDGNFCCSGCDSDRRGHCDHAGYCCSVWDIVVFVGVALVRS